MGKRVVLVDAAAPIPVGHRVEVRILKEPKAGFLSRRSGAKHQTDQPWVRDLDTGVTYGVLWQYSDAMSVTTLPGEDWGASVRSDLEEVERFEGKVRACRVLTVGGANSGNWWVQTRLELET